MSQKLLEESNSVKERLLVKINVRNRATIQSRNGNPTIAMLQAARTTLKWREDLKRLLEYVFGRFGARYSHLSTDTVFS